MQKKILVLLLIVAMVISVVAGCTAKEETPGPAETPKETPKDTPDNTAKDTPDKKPEAKEMNYKDGTYYAELEDEGKDWQPRVELVVENGKITEVDYDEYDDKDNRKSEDKEYNQQWESVANTNAVKAYPELEKRLIEVQDIEAVDTVSGATMATELFKKAVAEAIKEGPQKR